MPASSMSMSTGEEIGFGAFVQVYNSRMGAERRKHRGGQDCFEKLTRTTVGP